LILPEIKIDNIHERASYCKPINHLFSAISVDEGEFVTHQVLLILFCIYWKNPSVKEAKKR